MSASITRKKKQQKERKKSSLWMNSFHVTKKDRGGGWDGWRSSTLGASSLRFLSIQFLFKIVWGVKIMGRERSVERKKKKQERKRKREHSFNCRTKLAMERGNFKALVLFWRKRERKKSALDWLIDWFRLIDWLAFFLSLSRVVPPFLLLCPPRVKEKSRIEWEGVEKLLQRQSRRERGRERGAVIRRPTYSAMN